MKITTVLDTIADITTGYPFRSGISDDPSGTVRVIQMRDTKPPATVAWEDAARVVMEKNMMQYLLCDDDILFVMRGGRYYAIHVGTVPCQAVASPHFFRIRAKAQAIKQPFWLGSLIRPRRSVTIVVLKLVPRKKVYVHLTLPNYQ